MVHHRANCSILNITKRRVHEKYDTDYLFNHYAISSISAAGPPNGEYVRVVVTDSYPNNNEDTHYFTIIGMSFALEEGTGASSSFPESFAIVNNYPNPFNPTTNISYDLPEQSDVVLQVFDLMGRKIITLESAIKAPGSYSATFDASNLSSGLYIARLRATGLSGEVFVRELKMQLIK